MATFISVRTDPFEEVFANARETPSQPNVRRPLRGIQLKEDTYASLRAKTASGDDIPLFDSSSSETSEDIGQSAIYSNFLLQSVSEQRAEKQQIVETFGEDYIFFFGEKPRFLQVQGVLLNTADFNWKSEFWANYETTLRGTRMVEQNARMYLYFDDIIVEGYILEAGAQLTTTNPYHLPFSFSMFITNYAILSSVGNVRYQAQQDAPQTDGLVPASEDAQKELAKQAYSEGGAGGLGSFLAAAAAKGLQGVNTTFQSALETISDTFYGRQLVVPEGLGTQLITKPIVNQAVFAQAPTGQPIWAQQDEYLGDANIYPSYDEEERKRVSGILQMRTPEELEARARRELEAKGIDVTRRETNYLLLGRGAFAATQYMGSFGIRQADGLLGNAGSVVDTIT